MQLRAGRNERVSSGSEEKKEDKTEVGRGTERGTEGHIDVIDTVSSISLDNIT